ncbi:hypothetical protein BT69DRAFT_1358103 [Atractiella rhizophila]|nr:hypothetical protein BT69DRAFT_1358103 [Atractiella rhizophila]
MELHPPANADDGNSLGNIPNNNLNATNDVAIDALQGDIPLQQADIALGNGSISEEATGKPKNSVVYTWENRGSPPTEGETTPAKVPISCLCCKAQKKKCNGQAKRACTRCVNKWEKWVQTVAKGKVPKETEMGVCEYRANSQEETNAIKALRNRKSPGGSIEKQGNLMAPKRKRLAPEDDVSNLNWLANLYHANAARPMAPCSAVDPVINPYLTIHQSQNGGMETGGFVPHIVQSGPHVPEILILGEANRLNPWSNPSGWNQAAMNPVAMNPTSANPIAMHQPVMNPIGQEFHLEEQARSIPQLMSYPTLHPQNGDIPPPMSDCNQGGDLPLVSNVLGCGNGINGSLNGQLEPSALPFNQPLSSHPTNLAPPAATATALQPFWESGIPVFNGNMSSCDAKSVSKIDFENGVGLNFEFGNPATSGVGVDADVSSLFDKTGTIGGESLSRVDLDELLRTIEPTNKDPLVEHAQAGVGMAGHGKQDLPSVHQNAALAQADINGGIHRPSDMTLSSSASCSAAKFPQHTSAVVTWEQLRADGENFFLDSSARTMEVEAKVTSGVLEGLRQAKDGASAGVNLTDERGDLYDGNQSQSAVIRGQQTHEGATNGSHGGALLSNEWNLFNSFNEDSPINIPSSSSPISFSPFLPLPQPGSSSQDQESVDYNNGIDEEWDISKFLTDSGDISVDKVVATMSDEQ